MRKKKNISPFGKLLLELMPIEVKVILAKHMLEVAKKVKQEKKQDQEPDNGEWQEPEILK